ncbi:MAG: S41 family peptidase [Balneolaceae bacterium]
MNFKILLLISFISIASLTGCASSKSAQNFSYSTQFTPEQTEQDVDFLFNATRNINPLLFENPLIVTSFKQRLDSVRNEILVPLTRTEFYVRFAPVLSSLQDGHTYLSIPFDDISNYLNNGGLLLPFDVIFLDEQIFIKKNYSDDLTFSAGMEIHSINGVSANQILLDLSQLQSGKNPNWGLRRMEGRSDLFKAFLWMKYGWNDTFDLQVTHHDESIHQILSGVKIETIRSQRESTNTSNLFNYRLIEHDIGYLQVSYFGGKTKSFRQFLKSTFDQIQKDQIDHLIIDVRDNVGGNSDQADELLSYFASEPFNSKKKVSVRASEQFKEHAKQRIPKTLRWLPLQYLDAKGRAIWRADDGAMVVIDEEPVQPKPKSKRFTGNTYLLINEGSFSTAAVFASAFKRLGYGELIGRTTGGEDGIFYAESINVTLPNNDLNLVISSMKFQLDDESARMSKPGVVPNIYVNKILEDEIDSVDTILDEAKKLITNSEIGN